MKLFRPQVMIMAVGLLGLAAYAVYSSNQEIALACVVALAAAVTKLVES